MKTYKVRAMADIVINHRVGTTQGHGGMYNRYDGIPLSWDEHAVTVCTGGKVMRMFTRFTLKEGSTTPSYFLVPCPIIREMFL